MVIIEVRCQFGKLSPPPCQNILIVYIQVILYLPFLKCDLYFIILHVFAHAFPYSEISLPFHPSLRKVHLSFLDIFLINYKQFLPLPSVLMIPFKKHLITDCLMFQLLRYVFFFLPK